MSPEWQDTLLGVMLGSSLRVCVLAGAVGGILRLARVRSGSLRHAAWCAVLGAMLLMPVLPYWLPAIEVPWPSRARRVEAIPAAIESAWTESDRPFIEPPGSSATPAPTGPSLLVTVRGSPSTLPVVWPLVVFGVYLAGLVFLLARLLFGWLAMRRIVRTGSRVENRTEALSQDPGRVDRAEALFHETVALFESAVIATPVTVGIFSPKILLPSAWKLWPETKLRAVLAHECAHVRRRDPLTALLARLNLCLFWFHPVAWWLEKQLATTAEHACDDAGLRVMGEKRRYADVLLDMAEAVRRAGGRLSWDGVGLHGSGLLGQRIDRILRGDLFRDISMTRKAIVAISCALAIVIVVACRQQRPAPPPLKPDPKIVEIQNRNKADSALYRAARAMNAAQVAELETYLQTNPEDLTARRKALMFYQPGGEPVPGENGKWAAPCTFVIPESECVANRRRHILWLIEHHPDLPMAGEFGARIFPTSLDPLPDPTGYDQAKKLWLARVAQPDTGASVLHNAFWFFQVPDKPLAESIALRAQSLDPKARWSSSLGELYALVIVGSNASMPMGVVRSVSLADTHGAYAQGIRKKLAETANAEVLRAAASSLVQRTGLVRDRLDFDSVALGNSYLQRVLQMNPHDALARATLLYERTRERNIRLHEMLTSVPADSRYQKIVSLSEADQVQYLPWLAYSEYMTADYYKHDQAAMKTAYARVRKYAEQMLKLAPKFKDSPDYGTLVYEANAVLGLVTFREGGDTQVAVKYAIEASNAPASEELAYRPLSELQELARYLARYGERESVAGCLERIAKINIVDRDRLLEDAAKIRQGISPWYR